MSDPLSISASIIAILQLADTVISYINSVKGGSVEREKLRAELTSTIGLLFLIKDHIDRAQTKDDWNATAAFLGAPNGPIEQFKASLDALAATLAPKSQRVDKIIHALSWPFSEKEVTKILNAIERQKTCFNLALQNDHIAISREIRAQLTGITDNVDELTHAVTNLNLNAESILKDAKTQNLLAWLSPFDFAVQQADYFTRCQEGTGQWLLVTEEFQKWCDDGPEKTLFCPGIPGAGKSMLASIVINYLQTTVDRSESAIAYLFCSYRSAIEQTATNMMANILRQVLEQDNAIPEKLRKIHEEYGKDRKAVTMKVVSDTIDVYFSKPRKLFVVIDALDEYPNGSGKRQRLLAELSLLQERYPVQLLATSRPVPNIMTAFADAVKIEIRASHDDIARYLDGQMFRMPTCVAKRDDLKTLIKEEIAAAVDGMFLLAKLHVDALVDKTSPKAIKVALAGLKKRGDALSLAYDEAFNRVNEQTPGLRHLALAVLSWVANARAPMSVDELRHAIATEADESDMDEENLMDADDLVSGCAGLVTVEIQSNIVRFVHYTTQEYFDGRKQQLFPSAPYDMLGTCLTYLSFDAFQVAPERHECEDLKACHPFLQHAATYWDRYSQLCRDEDDVDSLVLKFLERRGGVHGIVAMLWTGEYGYDMPWPRKGDFCFAFKSFSTIDCLPGLHVAAALGRVGVVSTLLTGGHDVNTRSENGEAAIHAALANNHETMVRLLLAEGAIVEVDLLRSAIEVGNFATFELIAGLIPTEAIQKICNESTRSPLQLATQHDEVQMAEYLVKAGADINRNCMDGINYYALQQAAERGCLPMVTMLLENGADPTLGQGELGSPLFASLYRSHHEIATILVEHGAAAKVFATSDSPDYESIHKSSMAVAAQEGSEDLMRLMLSKRSKEEKANGQVGVALTAAAINGSVKMTELLLEAGANVNHFDDDGSALTMAVLFEKHDIIRLLLKKGADANMMMEASAMSSGTALLDVVEEHEGEMLRIMLEEGVDVNVPDGEGYNILYRATKNQCLEMMSLLINHGMDIDFAGPNDRTALHAAAESGSFEAVRLLLENGAQVDRCTTEGWTALYLAAEGGNLDIIRTLLAEGADPNKSMPDGWAPLHAAVKFGGVDVIQLLLEHGADVNRCGLQGWTALHMAIEKLNLAVVQMLLASRADVELRTSDGDSPLLLSASQNDTEAIFRALLDAGADVTRSKNGYTVLHCASNRGNSKIVELALKAGVDMNAQLEDGRTPLDVAIAKDHKSVMTLLLDRGAKSGRPAVAEDNTSGDVEVGQNSIDEKRAGRQIGDNQANGETQSGDASDGGQP